VRSRTRANALARLPPLSPPLAHLSPPLASPYAPRLARLPLSAMPSSMPSSSSPSHRPIRHRRPAAPQARPVQADAAHQGVVRRVEEDARVQEGGRGAGRPVGQVGDGRRGQAERPERQGPVHVQPGHARRRRVRRRGRRGRRRRVGPGRAPGKDGARARRARARAVRPFLRSLSLPLTPLPSSFPLAQQRLHADMFSLAPAASASSRAVSARSACPSLQPRERVLVVRRAARSGRGSAGKRRGGCAYSARLLSSFVVRGRRRGRCEGGRRVELLGCFRCFLSSSSAQV